MASGLPVPTQFKMPRHVRLYVSRWRVRLEVDTYSDGEFRYEFSADSEDTGGDGISIMALMPDGTMCPVRP